MSNTDYSLLQKIYEHHLTYKEPLQVYADGSNTGYTTHELLYFMQMFKDAGYIQRKSLSVGVYLLTITLAGIDFVENGFKSPSENSSTTVTYNNHIENISNSPIAIGENATQNFNTSIQEAREQLDASNSKDKEALHQVLDLLEMVLNNQVPAQKGLFSRFSDALQKNTWITSHIASALIGWLTGNL